MALDPGIAAWLRTKQKTTSSSGFSPAPPPDSIVGNAAYGGQYVGRTDPTPEAPAPRSAPAGVTRAVSRVNAPSQADLYSLIYGDPGYQQAKAGSDMQLSNAAAQRRAALRSLVTRYGDIGGLTDTYGDVDQATLDAAKNNPYSDINRTQRGYESGVEGFKRSLAARGALQSGDLPYGLGQLDYQKGQSLYDLANEFGTGASNALGDYSNAEAQQQLALAQAIKDAAARISQWWTPQSDTDVSEAGDLNADLGTSVPTSVQEAIDQGLPIQPDGSVLASDVPPAYAPGTPVPTLGGVLEGAVNYDRSLTYYRDPYTGEIYTMPGTSFVAA